MNISVVIPAFNESKTIIKTIEKVQKYFVEHEINGEIIVVDDCSTDDTLVLVQKMHGIRVLRNLKNHGKGYSVRKGVLAATQDWILFMDADNSTDISELSKFEKHLSAYDILIASRALPESQIVIRQNKVKILLGRLGNFIIRLLIDKNIQDSQCGFKIFNRKVQALFQQVTLSGFGFDFELIWLVKKNKFKIKEVPIAWVNDDSSSVKWWHYPKVFFEVFKVRINDLLHKYN